MTLICAIHLWNRVELAVNMHGRPAPQITGVHGSSLQIVLTYINETMRYEYFFSNRPPSA